MNYKSQKPTENLFNQFMKPNFMLKVVVICTLLTLGGCKFVYKADIQQGNDITAQVVSQLEVGMTKREVIRIAGSPLINDPFHKDRWDYYYSKRNGKTGETVQHIASLKFADDLLSEITSSFD